MRITCHYSQLASLCRCQTSCTFGKVGKHLRDYSQDATISVSSEPQFVCRTCEQTRNTRLSVTHRRLFFTFPNQRCQQSHIYNIPSSLPLSLSSNRRAAQCKHYKGSALQTPGPHAEAPYGKLAMC